MNVLLALISKAKSPQRALTTFCSPTVHLSFPSPSRHSVGLDCSPSGRPSSSSLRSPRPWSPCPWTFKSSPNFCHSTLRQHCIRFATLLGEGCEGDRCQRLPLILIHRKSLQTPDILSNCQVLDMCHLSKSSQPPYDVKPVSVL